MSFFEFPCRRDFFSFLQYYKAVSNHRGASYRIFKHSKEKEMVDYQNSVNLHVPARTTAKSEAVMCLA
jgi:hypothetical protein